MIGWNYTMSRDYAEGVTNGRYDNDLHRMKAIIDERIEEVHGVHRCPACGELLRERHNHEGFIVIPVHKPEVEKREALSVAAERKI